MKKGLFLIPLAATAFAGDFKPHVLKEGETISDLLKRHGFKPLYGKDQWVNKTLELNHLTPDGAAKIKKGYPIFLPSKKEDVREDKVSIKKAAIIREGLFGNTISDHQRVYLELDYFASDVALKNSDVTLGQNYGLGLRVDGANDYKIGDLTYNFYGSAFVYTHGIGEFEGKDDLATSFSPTYQFDLGADIKSPELVFTFGPTIRLEERSRLEETNENVDLRRDRLAWFGVNFEKTFEANHLLYQTNAGYMRKMIGQSLNGGSEFSASQVYAMGKINLSRDYNMGIKATHTQYDNIGIKQENSIGLNFSYNLK